MQSETRAGADAHALVSAAYMGAIVGLALGPIYLAGGLGRAAEEHSRAERMAAAAERALSEGGLQVVSGPAAGVADLTAPPAGAGMAAKPSRARELDCLAQAVYFEARGETPRGQAAVATVIMNRVKNPKFPKTVCGVVYQGAGHRNGCQFSFACDGAAERVVEATAWQRARKVAGRVLAGAVLADIGSATHFHTIAVAPDWGPRMLRVSQVGLHVFYRLNPRALAQSAAPAPERSVLIGLPAPAEQPVELRLAAAVVENAGDKGQAATAVAPATAPADVKPAAKSAEAPIPVAKVAEPAASPVAATS